MISEIEIPVPPPAVVREMLARNTRQTQLLRSLLKLSCKAHSKGYRPKTAKETKNGAMNR